MKINMKGLENRTFWAIGWGLNSYFLEFQDKEDCYEWFDRRMTSKGVRLHESDGTPYFIRRREFRVIQAYWERQEDGSDLLVDVRR